MLLLLRQLLSCQGKFELILLKYPHTLHIHLIQRIPIFLQVFMACLWVLHEMLVIFFYWNLPALKKEEASFKIKEQLTYPPAGSSGSFTSLNIPPPDTAVSEDRRYSYTMENSSLHNEQQRTDTPELRETRAETERENPCTFQVGSAPLKIERGESVMSTSSGAIETAEKYMSQSPGYLQYAEAYTEQNLTKTSSQENIDERQKKLSGSNSILSSSNNNSDSDMVTNLPSAVTDVAFENPVADYGAISNGDINSVSAEEDDTQPAEQKRKHKLTWRFLYRGMLSYLWFCD